MKKKTKKIMTLMSKSMLIFAIILLCIAFCLFSMKMGFGFKLEPPFCWASFLQMGVFMFSAWAFNQEIFLN
jgi:hypothetical protein